MNVLFIPLDERPCNRIYPQQLAALRDETTLIVAPNNLLGQKKQSADVDKLWGWIYSQVGCCNGAIISLEMLVYGGLLPSRLHQHSISVLSDRLNRIRQLKLDHPQLILFASNLIMRTPDYDSSEEEPDYYADWGKAIFRWGWLYDKQQRDGLTELETVEFDQLRQTLPFDHLNDYRDRRSKNLAVNQGAIALVQDGTIDFLSIPQDDSARYGFTALDQKQVVSQIIDARLQQRIHFYPGADEVGCTLLARMALTPAQSSPENTPPQPSPYQGEGAGPPVSPYVLRTGFAKTKGGLRGVNFYIFYSSVNSESIIPLYEDRPLGESVKSHVLAAGANWVWEPQQADVILAINTPGKMMQEAWDQPRKDITYSTYRNLRFFVYQIGQFLAAGKPVAIADVAFANGGETELVQMLDDAQLWDDILAYAGWNTCCNTLGTAIASASLGFNSTKIGVIQHNKIYRLLEDWAYQSVARMDIANQYLPSVGASYYDFNDQEALVLQTIEQQLLHLWDQMMQQSFQNVAWQIKVLSPWQRMFEVEIELNITS
ncbi:MAG: DUF4127 family protein [Cyanobacteria bacterium P01_F01_bin.150]